jgi:hypothetical protein
MVGISWRKTFGVLKERSKKYELELSWKQVKRETRLE